MATMNPVLRLRNAFRSIATNETRAEDRADEIADEAVDAITSYSYSQRESDLRHAQMLAELGKEMAELRNQILLGTLLIVGVAVAILTVVIAVID